MYDQSNGSYRLKGRQVRTDSEHNRLTIQQIYTWVSSSVLW